MVLPGAQFSWWANLTSIFLVIPFVLEQQAWFRVCVVLVVPITFRFIIPLTWCHRWLITSSWNLSTIVSWSSSTLWALTGYQSKMRNTILSPRWFVLSSTTFLLFPLHKLVHIILAYNLFDMSMDCYWTHRPPPHLFPDKITWYVLEIPDGFLWIQGPTFT